MSSFGPNGLCTSEKKSVVGGRGRARLEAVGAVGKRKKIKWKNEVNMKINKSFKKRKIQKKIIGNEIGMVGGKIVYKSLYFHLTKN